MNESFKSRGAHPARVSHHGEAADRPQTTCRVARTWRGCVMSQRAARSISTPSVEARLRRHRDRSAAWCLAGLARTFESRGARPARVSHHGVAADIPRSTRRAARTWRGCVVGQRAARTSPCRRSRRDRTNTATGRRRGTRQVLTSAFASRGAQSARVSHHEVPADGPRSTNRIARTWRGCVVSQHAARSIYTASVEARPQQHRDQSTPGAS